MAIKKVGRAIKKVGRNNLFPTDLQHTTKARTRLLQKSP